jgi:hypothetical protein
MLAAAKVCSARARMRAAVDGFSAASHVAAYRYNVVDPFGIVNGGLGQNVVVPGAI